MHMTQMIARIVLTLSGMGLLLGCGGQRKQQDPLVLSTTSWRESLPSGSFRTNVPVRITLLHSGVPMAPGADLRSHLKNLQQQHLQKGWGELGAHYYIAPDGAIAEGRSTFLQGRLDEEDDFDRSGHVFIMLFGDYDEQPLSPMLKEKLIQFFVWLSNQKTLAMDSVRGLNAYVEQTSSPGKNVTEWLESDEYETLVQIALGLPVNTPTPTPTRTPVPQSTPTPGA